MTRSQASKFIREFNQQGVGASYEYDGWLMIPMGDTEFLTVDRYTDFVNDRAFWSLQLVNEAGDCQPDIVHDSGESFTMQFPVEMTVPSVVRAIMPVLRQCLRRQIEHGSAFQTPHQEYTEEEYA